jgi:hypothetical protein
MVDIYRTSLHGFIILSGRCASFSEVRSLVISDNVVPDKVAGVHDMKGTEGEKSSTLPTIFDEVVARLEVSVWLHYKYCLFNSLLIGDGNCAYERFILIETDEELLIISRSNDGLLFHVNKSTQPNAVRCVNKVYQHIA